MGGMNNGVRVDEKIDRYMYEQSGQIPISKTYVE